MTPAVVAFVGYEPFYHRGRHPPTTVQGEAHPCSGKDWLGTVRRGWQGRRPNTVRTQFAPDPRQYPAGAFAYVKPRKVIPAPTLGAPYAPTRGRRERSRMHQSPCS